MKKQLLAAAVAATMASVASADISITGAAKVNYTYVDKAGSAADTNTFKREMDLAVTGKSGDTTVVTKFAFDNSDASSNEVSVEDSYLTTKIGDVSIKTGAWDNGNNALRASSRGDDKFSASTSFGDITLTYDASGDAGDDTVKVAAKVAGVSASYKAVDGGEDITLGGSFGGVNVSYLALNKDAANSDRSVVEISTDMNGVGLKIAQATADSATRISGDTWMGDFEDSTFDGTTSNSYDLQNDQDVMSVELSTKIDGNSVKLRMTDIDGVAGSDTSFNKVIVTRPLANGTTFEATYTDLNDDNGTDSNTLDLELAVKF